MSALTGSTREEQLELARRSPRQALIEAPSIIAAAKTTADLEHARLFGLLATANAGDYWAALQHAVGVASCCERLPEAYRGRATRALTSVARANDDLITATLTNRLAHHFAPAEDATFLDALDDDVAQIALAAGDAVAALESLQRVCQPPCPADTYARSQWLVRQLHQARAFRLAGDPQRALRTMERLPEFSDAFDGFTNRVHIESFLDRLELGEPVSEPTRERLRVDAEGSGLASLVALANAIGVRTDLLRRRAVDATEVLRTVTPLERAGYGAEALAIVHDAATLAATQHSVATVQALRDYELAQWERRFDGFRPVPGSPLAALRTEVLQLAARALPIAPASTPAPTADALESTREKIDAGLAVPAVQDCAVFATHIVGPESVEPHGDALRLMIRAIALSGDVEAATIAFGRLAAAQHDPLARATTQAFEGRAALGSGAFGTALTALSAAQRCFAAQTDASSAALLCQVHCDIAYTHTQSGRATDALAAASRARESAAQLGRERYTLRAEAAWMLSLTAAGAPVDPDRARDLANRLVHANSVREAMAFIEVLNGRFGSHEPVFAVALAEPLMVASHLPPTLPNMRRVFERTREILNDSGQSDAVAELVTQRAKQLRMHLQQMARIVSCYADVHLALARALPATTTNDSVQGSG